MRFAFYILHFALFIFFIGCATKTKPLFVTIKSPKIKISDSGFLKESFGYKKLIIYKAGNEPIEIILKRDDVCLNKQCFNKYLFFKEYFGIKDKNFFDTILEKKPFRGVKVIKTTSGFIQKSNFVYKVNKASVFFKKDNLIIYIRFLKEKN